MKSAKSSTIDAGLTSLFHHAKTPVCIAQRQTETSAKMRQKVPRFVSKSCVYGFPDLKWFLTVRSLFCALPRPSGLIFLPGEAVKPDPVFMRTL